MVNKGQRRRSKWAVDSVKGKQRGGRGEGV